MANVSARQSELVAMVNLSIQTAATTTIELPPKSMVTGGSATVHVIADGTSPTLTMVDDAGSPNTYLSAVAVDVAGVNFQLATAETGNYYPNGATLSFTTGGTDDPADGEIIVAVRYSVLGRQTDTYGPSA